MYKERVVKDAGMVRLHNDPKSYFFPIFYKYLESIVPSNDAIPKYSKCIVITRRYITSMIKQLLFCEKNWLRENMLIVLQIKLFFDRWYFCLA